MHRVPGNPTPCPIEEGKFIELSWKGVDSSPPGSFNHCGPLRSSFTSVGVFPHL